MQPSPFPQQDATRGGVVNADADSWIEVSSQPSDSVYTSSSEEHIITAGLRISKTRRRRRGAFKPTTAAPDKGISSGDENEQAEQEEEEEEEEEGEDIVSMIRELPMSSDGYSSPSQDDDSDDEASSSDIPPGPRTVFASSSRLTPAATSLGNRRHGHAAFSMFAPTHAADHDEALRASLSTLLSCAAAARGLSKSPTQSQQIGTQQQQQQQQPHHHQAGGRVAVEGIRVVREGDLPSEASGSVHGKSRRNSLASVEESTGTTTSEGGYGDASKKKGRRTSKRSRSRATVVGEPAGGHGDVMGLGVSFVTLAVSAGALVLVSAITFSAGYAIGREVGKSEGDGLFRRMTGGAGRGKAVVRGLAGGGGLRLAVERGIGVTA